MKKNNLFLMAWETYRVGISSPLWDQAAATSIGNLLQQAQRLQKLNECNTYKLSGKTRMCRPHVPLTPASPPSPEVYFNEVRGQLRSWAPFTPPLQVYPRFPGQHQVGRAHPTGTCEHTNPSLPKALCR